MASRFILIKKLEDEGILTKKEEVKAKPSWWQRLQSWMYGAKV